LIWPRPRGGIAPGQKLAAGLLTAGFAYGRVGRDAVERSAFGAAELVGDLAESVDSWVRAVAFSPDGTRVATASSDDSARIIEVKPDLLVRRAIDVMTRPLNSTELRRYSLSPTCRHVEQWSLRGNAGIAERR
jgi:WD40 repeat protein